MKRATLIALLMVGVAVAAACSRRQQEWEAARRADTVEAYQQFVQSFPEGEFTSQARARMRELEEARDWQNAQSAGTAEAYQEFLARHPEGRMADEARIRLGNLALALTPSGPAQALPAGEPSATAAAADATAAAPAVAAPARAPSADAYRIQLGAFSGGDQQAMGEWRRLQREYPQLLNGLTPSVKLATTGAGHLYRLQAGDMTEARARDACTRLRLRGQACLVVPP